MARRKGKKRTEYRIEAHLFVRVMNEKEAEKFNARFQEMLKGLIERDFKWAMALTGGHASLEPLE